MSKDQIVKIPFKFLSTFSLSGGVGSVPLQPVSFSRVLEIADAYDLYRFVRLRYRLRSPATSFGTQGAAYYPGVTDTTPTTLVQLGENMHSVFVMSGETVPSNWHTVPRQALSGMLPWYKTIAGSLDTSEEQQGTLYIVGTGTETVYLELEGLVEVKAPASIANTPAARRERAQRLAKERLLSVLGGTPGGATVVK